MPEPTTYYAPDEGAVASTTPIQSIPSGTTANDVTVTGAGRDKAPNYKRRESNWGDEVPSSTRALVLCLFMSFAGVIFGWGSSEGGVLFNNLAYRNRFGTCNDGNCVVETTRQSAITGMMSVGALLGAVFSGAISDYIGIRKTCLAFVFMHMIGCAIDTASINYKQIYCARLIMGLGIGATSGLVPVFQGEIAPPKWRGFVTGSYQLMNTLGIWGVSMCGWGMAKHEREGNMAWRVTTGLAMLWSFLCMCAFFLCPESPKYLAMNGKMDECRQAFSKIRNLPLDSPVLDHEIAHIQAAADKAKEVGKVSYKEVFSTKDRILWRLMIGCGIQIGQQITGINFFFSYGVQFARAAGLNDSYIFQIILASVNVGTTLPGLVAVDKYGRRPVLLTGGGVMFAAQIITGAISKAYPGAKGAGKLLIAFCCFFVAAFASSWGPVAWIVCGETFPARVASRCATIATAANWLFNLIIAFAAPQIQDRIGTGICFIWAGALLIDITFAFLTVPETKGLSLDQIDILYHAHVPAWKSNGWLDRRRSERRLSLGITDPPPRQRVSMSEKIQRRISNV